GEARAAGAERALRPRSRGARVYVERAARSARGRRRAHRLGGGRRAADPRPRLAPPARDRFALLLEERQVAARPRAPHRRPARLLGAVRLPQRRGLPEGRALQLLSARRFTRSGERKPPGSADIGRRTTSP